MPSHHAHRSFEGAPLRFQRRTPRRMPLPKSSGTRYCGTESALRTDWLHMATLGFWARGSLTFRGSQPSILFKKRGSSLASPAKRYEKCSDRVSLVRKRKPDRRNPLPINAPGRSRTCNPRFRRPKVKWVRLMPKGRMQSEVMS